MQLAKLTLSRSCSASLPDRIQTTDNFALVPKLRKKNRVREVGSLAGKRLGTSRASAVGGYTAYTHSLA
jgi:hypothetical protein